MTWNVNELHIPVIYETQASPIVTNDLHNKSYTFDGSCTSITTSSNEETFLQDFHIFNYTLMCDPLRKGKLEETFFFNTMS